MTSILPGNLGVIASAGKAAASAFASNGTTATSSWNLAGANISNSNRTIANGTYPNYTGFGLGAKATTGYPQLYFEIVINRLTNYSGGSSIFAGIGIQIPTTNSSSPPSSAAVVAFPGYDSQSAGLTTNTQSKSFDIYTAGSVQGSYSATPAVGQVIMVAVDNSSNLSPYCYLYFGLNGAWVLGDPSTNTAAIGIIGVGGGSSIRLMCTVGYGASASTGDQITLNTSAAQCTYTPPSGFTYWG